MKRAYDTTRSAAVCRTALMRGTLVMDKNANNGGCTWAFGHRKFSAVTVARLIQSGEAVRDGDLVRAA